MIAMGKIIPLLMGMLIKKSDTVLYPSVKAQVAEKFRGALKFHSEKCVGCKICERVCPADAILITKVVDKQFKATVYLDRCIFCGQCVDSCNKDALENTTNFELASADKNSLKVDI